MEQGKIAIKQEAFAEARAHLARCVKLAGVEASAIRLRCLRLGGVAAQRMGAFPCAVAAYRDALVVAEAMDDHSAITAIWNGLGFLHQTQGDYAAAIDSYRQAQLHEGAEPTPIQLARCLNNIASLFNDLAHHGLALEYLDRSEHAFRLTGKGETRYPILVNRGLAHQGLGEHDLALENYRRALVLQREAGSERSEATSLSNIGTLHLEASARTSVASGQSGPRTSSTRMRKTRVLGSACWKRRPISAASVEEQIEVDVTIEYPDPSKILRTQPTTRWMEKANDFVYWGEVADILKYDDNVMFAELLVFNAQPSDFIRDTTFDGFVDPDPLPIIIWNGPQRIALEPWGNLDDIQPVDGTE